MTQILSQQAYFSDIPFHITTGSPGSHYPEHIHDFSELSIILDGTGNHIIEGKKYPISAGEVFVINGQTRHSLSDLRNLVICNIKYDFGFYFSELKELNLMTGFNYLFRLHHLLNSDFKSRLVLRRAQLLQVSSLLKGLENEFIDRNEGYQTMIKSLFYQLVVLLSRQYVLEQSPADIYQGISAAIAYIESNYRAEIRLSEMLVVSGMSRSQFLRVFESVMQSTPNRYVQKLRIDHACRLMLTKDYTLTEVAYASGFTDLNYFSRLFVKVKGRRPGEYRKGLKIS